MSGNSAHRDDVHAVKAPGEVSWFEAMPSVWIGWSITAASDIRT